MFRVFLYTSLLLFLTNVSYCKSIQLTDNDLDEYIYDDSSDEIDSSLMDLDINAQERGDSYKKVLSFVKTLQESIDKEHTDLTRIFSAETQEHNNRKKELDEARTSVEKLRSSLQNTQWKISNLTNSLNNSGDERSRILNTIEYHHNLLKEELETVNKFYVESNKYKNYKEFSDIKKQIDELKNSVHNETTDVINIYSNLSTRLSNDLLAKRRELQIFRDQEKMFNASLTSEDNSFSKLTSSFQNFVNNYHKNTKQYKDATESYIEERDLLQKLSNFLQKTNPEKCLKVKKNYDELLKSHDVKTKANEQLLNQVDELKKEVDILNLKLNNCNNKQNSLQTNSKKELPAKSSQSNTNTKITKVVLSTPKPKPTPSSLRVKKSM